MRLAKGISLDDLRSMLVKARTEIMDWKEPSRVNPVFDRGTAFNMFSGCTFNGQLHLIAKRNMIWEFGEYLPGYQKPVRKKRYIPTDVHHEDPRPFPGEIVR
jgi:hypothetical protein